MLPSAERAGDKSVPCCASAWGSPCFCHIACRAVLFTGLDLCHEKWRALTSSPVSCTPDRHNPAVLLQSCSPSCWRAAAETCAWPHLPLFNSEFLPFTASHEGGGVTTLCHPAHRDFHSGHLRLKRSVCSPVALGAAERLLVCTSSH